MHFVETPVFTRLLRGHLDDEAYRGLQLALVLRPEMGRLIRRSGNVQDDLTPTQLRTLRRLVQEEFG